MTQTAPKDFELAIREVIDSYRKAGNSNQENIAMALETQAALVRHEDSWSYNSEEAKEARKRLGIQEPRPTEGEMKNALAARQALEGGRNLGMETDVQAPTSQADMEPIPLEDRPDPEQTPGDGAVLKSDQDTTGKSNKQKKAEAAAAASS